MMVEYIERDEARPDAFCRGVSCQDCPFFKSPLYGGCRIDDFIMSVPAADVRPVVHGKWLPVDEKEDAFDCSECDAMVSKRCNFCPHCGADMRKEESDG